MQFNTGSGVGFFYGSKEYQLLREGVADLHCMSDDYIAEDLKDEYEIKEAVYKNGKD